MKIIVTGGTGFIGSHLTDTYIKAGHKVAVIDSNRTGFTKNLNPRAKFYKADIRDGKAIDRIFKKEKPEVVNHHAAVAEVVRSLRDPMSTFEANLLGTVNILLGLGNHGKGKHRKIIFASSGATYGTPKHIPAAEGEPTHPESPYGLSKLLDEGIIKFYAEQYHFAYTIFRYPNVYGPRQNPKGEAGVTAIFGGLMKAGKRPIIFGDGTKARDYTYVGDIARANLIALKRGDNETINLGWGKTTTDQKIFDTLAKETKFWGKPVYAPHRSGEAYRVALDARKAKRLLGWEPKVTLEEGIKNVVDSLK